MKIRLPSPILVLILCVTGFRTQGLSQTSAPSPDGSQASATGSPRPRVALVLSGGAALGISHIGVIEEIERAGIPIDMVLGTSMGAIAGGLYAAGYSPEQLGKIVEDIDWSEVFNERRDSPGDRYYQLLEHEYPLRIGFDAHGFDASQGLLRGQNVLTLLTELTLHDLTVRDFDRLPVPYRAVAADILTGDKVVFSSGSLAEAMRASMSIPGLFRPYEYEGRSLVDGGIVDNMPVDVAREMGADIVIAVESRTPLATKAADLRSAISITSQALDLIMEENMRQSEKDADLLIVPDLHGFTAASYGDAGKLIERGREAGERAMPELRALAERIAARRALVRPEDQANRRAYREPPIIERLIVEGAGPGEEIIARAAFASIVGKRADRLKVKAAIDGLFASGRFDFVKFDLLPGSGSDEATAVLSLVPESLPNDMLLLGGDFRTVVSPLSGTEAFISPAVLARNLSGKGSALFVESSFIGQTEAYAEYLQPLGGIAIKPFGRYQAQNDSYTIGENLSVDSSYRSLGGGAWVGTTFSRQTDLRALWSFENLLYVGGQADLAALGLEFQIDTRRVTIFPERGFFADAMGRWADPAFGGQLAFVTAECEMGGAIPLSNSLSLGIDGYVGTDFRGFLPVGEGLPPEQYFSLRRSGIFYGLEPEPGYDIGESVAALGLETREHIGELNEVLGGDLFLLENISAGIVRVEGDPAMDFLPLCLDAAIGVGARLSSNFGILLAMSAVSDGNPAAAFRPALTIELGSFSAALDNRR
ncbi:MAG: patatin-like phospholipase family protein [Rectinemataceae bacterium]